MIEDTLDFARIEAGKLRVEIGDVPLAGFVDVIRDIIDVKAEQKRLDFICEIAGDAPVGVRADERRLRQVMLNLLANAVKFTDAGCVSLAYLEVRVEPRPFRSARHGDRHWSRSVEYDLRAVRATGRGRAASRRGRPRSGHQPRVRARDGWRDRGGKPDRAGQYFPFRTAGSERDARVAQDAGPAPLSFTATGYEGPRRKVLVVDDVEVNRAIVVDLLGRLGFDTVEAENGREGSRRRSANGRR